MALRLLFKDSQHRDVGVFLISAYAVVGKAPENEWEDYFDKLTTCLRRKRNNDIIVIGTDCNSSMGCKSDREIDSPLGCFGLNHTNESGLRFLTYLAINNLRVTATSFKKNHYTTWIHSRSKKLHQIDHFMVNCEMFHRVIDVGLTPQLLDSYHFAIFIEARNEQCEMFYSCKNQTVVI